jgi:uncharacterized protein (DUF362 family)/Pyruvate/2-oxoacid:ferredoxin oxidoreductase delta subunit
VELLGGLDRFVAPGERLLLKPNILVGEPPERAVTTHPSVLAASIRLLQQGGATVVFGDSPGVEAASRCGLLDAGQQAGGTFVDFSAARVMASPEARLVDSFPIARPIHDCDGIVNLPKMKTHQLTRITGAIKNLFGCIVGKRKALYHVQHSDVFEFSRLLAELCACLRPRLHILDAILAMEGNGPRSGHPRFMNVLLLSEDPVAVDATCCRLVVMDPTHVPTTVAGADIGLGSIGEENIELVGDDLAQFVRADFRVIRKPVYGNASYAYYDVLKRVLLPRPVIDVERCVKCGLCVDACPVPEKALWFRNGRQERPRYDYSRCIRCYCCQEMCPHRAIEQRTPLLGRVLRVA